MTITQIYLLTKFQLSSITVARATIVFVKVSDRGTDVHKETGYEEEEEEEEDEEEDGWLIVVVVVVVVVVEEEKDQKVE